MSISQEQIEKLAKNLSKLGVRDEKIWGDVNEILQYIDLLNEVDTTGVKPTVNVVETENILRKDEEKRTINPQDLLSCSQQKVISDQIAISNIMK